jgi:serine/threonine-protein kinase
MPARNAPSAEGPRVVGRYALFEEIAAGGMATVHLGRLMASAGFSRTVAIKRLYPQFAKDPEFVAMFLDEALLAARVRHPNVVGTIDVVALEGELLLVMEYVHGESLSRLLRNEAEANRSVPLRIASGLMTSVLHGLHAAHEARTETGLPLGIVHRDVSPHNVLVGQDGVARVLDFGVAKAAWRTQTTREGQIKGKLAYMSPEQLLNQEVDRRADIFAASTVLWEVLTGCRLFSAEQPGAVFHRVIHEPVLPPSRKRAEVPPELDDLVLKGLSKDRELRFASAREMAFALEKIVPPASTGEVSLWVEEVARETLAKRAKQVDGIESSAARSGTAVLAQPPVAAQEAGGSSDASAPASTSSHPPHKEALASSVATVSELFPTVSAGRSRLRVGLAVAAVALAGLAALAVGRWLGGPTRSAVSPGASLERPPARVEGPVAVDITQAEAPPQLTVPDAGTAATTAPVLPAASASPAPAVTHRAGAGPAAPGRPAVHAAPSARSHSSCTPPYTVDSAGFRVLKPECL